MAKFKPVRPKKDKTPPVQGGLPCIILLISGMILVCLVMYFVIKYANG